MFIFLLCATDGPSVLIFIPPPLFTLSPGRKAVLKKDYCKRGSPTDVIVKAYNRHETRTMLILLKLKQYNVQSLVNMHNMNERLYMFGVYNL